MPEKATKGSIGFDLFSSHMVILQSNKVTKVHTGLAMNLPKGIYCRISPCSGLSMKGISIKAGVIDNDYKGEIIIMMRNHTKSEIKLTNGQKAAQCIFEHASNPCLILSDNIS